MIDLRIKQLEKNLETGIECIDAVTHNSIAEYLAKTGEKSHNFRKQISAYLLKSRKYNEGIDEGNEYAVMRATYAISEASYFEDFLIRIKRPEAVGTLFRYVETSTPTNGRKISNEDLCSLVNLRIDFKNKLKEIRELDTIKA